MAYQRLILQAVLCSVVATMTTGFVQSFTEPGACQQQTLMRYRGLARASSTSALFVGDDSSNSREEALMSVLSNMNIDRNREAHPLPCGLTCSDKERDVIHSLISELELDPANVVNLKKGIVSEKELMGEWNLIYTNSKTMLINKGLSGLGRSASAYCKSTAHAR
jgi:hypothetical protein